MSSLEEWWLGKLELENPNYLDVITQRWELQSCGVPDLTLSQPVPSDGPKQSAVRV